MPTWATLVLGRASSVVAVVAIVANIVANELRDRRRLKHERETQQREHEEHLMSKLREERIRAYATLAQRTRGMDVANPTPLLAVQEAYAEIEILADDPELRKVADDLVDIWTKAWMSARTRHQEGALNPFDAAGYKDVRGLLDGLRKAFIERAKDEIGVKTLSREEPPEGSTLLLGTQVNKGEQRKGRAARDTWPVCCASSGRLTPG